MREPIVLPPLPELLDLPEVERGVFEAAPVDDGRDRTYGGLLAAQALAAASFSVEGAPCHSVHLRFLRPGRPGRPTHFEVTALRDARRFAQRAVLGIQRDEPLLHLTASFQGEATAGPELSGAAPGEVRAPEDCESSDTLIEKYLEHLPPDFPFIRWPMETRPLESEPWWASGESEGPMRMWTRHREPLPDYENLHRCALVYVSDQMMIAACVRALGTTPFDPTLRLASLDHALWFHRPFRADEWLLVSTEPVSIGAGRGLSQSRVFDRGGALVATVVQEALVHREE